MLITAFKRFLARIILYFLHLLAKSPKLKDFCINTLNALGLYNFLNKIRLRYQSNYMASEHIALTKREQLFYNYIAPLVNEEVPDVKLPNNVKKRLAFVSPLPPARSGISEYSAMLLPLLAEMYDITVITEQDKIDDAWINAHCEHHSPDWLLANASAFDRVLYHFGNAPFAEFRLDLIKAVPGVVVLHDFYLSHLIYERYNSEFIELVYHSHGYDIAAQINAKGYTAENLIDIVWQYPINLSVLQNALSVIVHAPYSQRLAKQFYGDRVADDWSVIPLLREPARNINKQQARSSLNLATDDFIVCCFGLTGATKLSIESLKAWLASDLAKSHNTKLIFVGDNDAFEYGKQLLTEISDSGLEERISITGWVSDDNYYNYLTAADIGIQLRSQSRGETSAAVLDCMNYGLATIVNANGAMVDLPSDTVYMIDDQFDIKDLTGALNELWKNTALRQQLAANSKQHVTNNHSPSRCAENYISTIETSYQTVNAQLEPLAHALFESNVINTTDIGCRLLAQAVTKVVPPTFQQKQFLIDISAIATLDLRTGIQRVVRAQLEVLLKNAPKGYRVEPVYLSYQGGQWRYHHAYRWTRQFLGLPCPPELEDVAVDFASEDILFCADLNTMLVVHANSQNLYQNLRNSGVTVYFQVYDLLPISHPHWFPKNSSSHHSQWAQVVAQSDGAFCISDAVANVFIQWAGESEEVDSLPNTVDFFHLGADIDTSSPSLGMPDDAADVLQSLKSSTSFLMVGTVEPRKGHSQTLCAFELLWAKGHDVKLVIIGKGGWLVGDLLTRLEKHDELGKRLFWLNGVSDEYLEAVYQAANCLIAASEDEGFGLPLIEAAQHKVPIIARKTAVFEEVAGEYAYYFNGLDPEDISTAVSDWLTLNADGAAPQSDNMPWLTWQQSTEQLINKMGLSLTR
jgi:glycosyltransferase involved in cell wall biosynthesis